MMTLNSILLLVGVTPDCGIAPAGSIVMLTINDVPGCTPISVNSTRGTDWSLQTPCLPVISLLKRNPLETETVLVKLPNDGLFASLLI